MSPLPRSLRLLYHRALPLPWKYGDDFGRLLRFYLELQKRSPEEVAAYQWSRLKALLAYAYAHVPYYRNQWTKLGIHPNDIKSRADYSRLPILHKEEIDANYAALKSDEFERWQPETTITSATTRDGVVLHRSRRSETIRHAVVWRHWLNLGYKFREPRVRMTVALPEGMPIYEPHEDLSENCLSFDLRSLTLDHAPKIYEHVRKFRPRMFYAQPSNLITLISYWRKHGLDPFTMPIVYVLGERLSPDYKRIIASFFGDNVVNYYGNRENTVSAGELTDRRMYVNSDFVYLEFIDDEGRAVVGRQANIISTGFENYAFPLIRYHSEDVGIDHGCPADAVTGHPVMEILGGRGKDLLLSREGLFCPDVIWQLRRINFEHYRRVQLEQVSLDKVIVRIEPNEKYEPQVDGPRVKGIFQEYFKSRFEVEYEVVDQIKITKGFKHRIVISELALAESKRLAASA